MNEECKRCDLPSEDLCNLIDNYEVLRIVVREFLDDDPRMRDPKKHIKDCLETLDEIVEDFNKEHGLE